VSDSRLGQIFYGRGPDGYGVLAASPAGRQLLGEVAALCRAVGSPDRPCEVPTFLLGKRDGDSAIMIRACRGAPDPTGRATIFFHALVADAELLRSAGLDAFVLEKVGAFVESCPGREPSDLPFPNPRKQAAAPTEPQSLDLPATISSDRPLDALVRRELGTKSLDQNWATFSFNPLPSFDLCVLSSYSPRKGKGTQYAFDGSGLHRLSPETTVSKNNRSNKLVRPNDPRKPSLFLFLSFAANAVLVLALLVRVGNHQTNNSVQTPAVVEMAESDAREKWESNWKEEWEASLPPPPSEMTEAEAKAKWASKWKAEWERSLPPPPSKMTEAEAKAKWGAKWEAERESSRPPSMTEDEAKTKFENEWKSEWDNHAKNELLTTWESQLREEFEKCISDSGGKWPVDFSDKNSPFLKWAKSETKPDSTDLKGYAHWRLYISCKACADFIKTHFNPTPSK